MRKIGLREIFLSSGTMRLKALKTADFILGSLAVKLIAAQAKRQVPARANRMLVIRPGGIGDAVFLLPIFKAIKEKFPNTAIEVLCQRRNAQVFLTQKHLVTRVFVYDSLISLNRLFKMKYDIVVDTEQWHYLSSLTALGIKSPIKIGFATRALRHKLFNHALDYDENAYELENFVSLFKSLLGSAGEIRNINDCFLLPENLKVWGKLQIPANSVVLSLAASVPERRLSREQIIVLAKGILQRGFYPVLLGGNDAVKPARQIIRHLQGAQVYNFVGKVSLQESAALIKASRLFMGTDSGLMHLACAVGSPVISLFGAGNMKKWFLPQEGQVCINNNQPCSPCTTFGYGRAVCGGTYPCLRKLDFDSMLDKYLSVRVKGE